MPRAFVALLLVLAPLTVRAEEWMADTLAGSGEKLAALIRGDAKVVTIGQPFGVEIGPEGRLYVTEVENHRIWRIDRKTGQGEVVVGSGSKGYAGDGGPAKAARLNEPYEVRFDAAGNLFFVEMQNHVVRRVDAKTGVIKTIAGTGLAGFGGDNGPATQAKFRQPHSLVLDKAGNIFIADIGNHRIRRIDAQTGLISTIAGDGTPRLPEPGAEARAAPLKGPRALALDEKTLWIALREGNMVWKLDLGSGKLWPVAGSGAKGMEDFGPGEAMKATFNGPKGIAIGPDQRLYLADTENHAVRVIDVATKTVSTIAGTGPAGKGFQGDGGDAKAAHFNRPHGICVVGDGTVFLGDSENHRVRMIRK